MKNLAKILTLVLVLALCVCGIVLIASADDAEPASVTAAPDFLPESITVDLTPDAAIADYTYLVYASEADFKADLADGTFDGKIGETSVIEENTTGNFTFVAKDAYYYLLQSVTATSTAAPKNAYVNLGGKELTLQVGRFTGTVGPNMAFFNGKLIEKSSPGSGWGTFTPSNAMNFAFRDVTVSIQIDGSTGNKFIWARYAAMNFYFENATVERTANGPCFLAFSYDINVTAKGSTIGVTSANNLFRYQTATAGANFYFDGDTKLNGYVLGFDATPDGTSEVNVTLESGLMLDKTVKTAFESDNVSSLTLLGNTKYTVFNSTGDATYTYQVGNLKAPDAPAFLPESYTATLTPDASIADYTYLVYASEADFKADLADGTFDGKINGTDALIVKDTAGNFTVPSATTSYVYILADITWTTTGTMNNCYVNLGDRALTIQIENDYNELGNGKDVAFVNGKIIDKSTTSGWGTFTKRNQGGNSKLVFKDVEISLERSAFASNNFIRIAKGSLDLFLEGSSVTWGGGKRFISFLDNFGVNVTAKNTTFKVSDSSLFVNDGNATQANLYFDGNTKFEGNVLNVAKAPDYSKFSVTLEKGAMLNDAAKTSFESIPSLVLNGTTDYTQFKSISDATYTYQVVDPAAVVAWYNGDNKLTEETYFAGETPSYKGASIGNIAPDGNGGYTMTTADGWAATVGGTEKVVFAPVEEGDSLATLSYYAITETKSAKIVQFENGVPTNAWAEATLTKDMVAAFPANSTVKFFDDITFTATEAFSFDTYSGNLTIDFNTHTLRGVNTTTSAAAGDWHTPVAGVTVTLMNGKLVYTAAEGGTISRVATFNVKNGAGTLKFTGVDIDCDTTSLASAAYSNQSSVGGTLIVENANVNAGNGANNSGISLNNAFRAVYTVELRGVNWIQTGAGAVLISRNYQGTGGGFSSVNVTVTDYNGTYSNIKTGYLVANKGESIVRTDTKINITVKNTVLNMNNNLLNGERVWQNADLDTAKSLTKSNIVVTIDNVFINKMYTDKTADLAQNEFLVAGATCDGEYIYPTLNIGPLSTVSGISTAGYYYGTPVVDMEANLTLESDFTLNFYLPMDTNISTITGAVTFDKNDASTYEIYTDLDGIDWYQVRVHAITPDTAAAYVTLTITYSESANVKGQDTVTYTKTSTAKYSVVKYTAGILAGEYTNDEKNSAKAIVAYVAAAYNYFDGSEDDAHYAMIETLMNAYSVANYVATFTPAVHENDTDLDGVVAAFKVDNVTKLYFKADVKFTVTDEDGNRVSLVKSDVAEYDYMVKFRAYDLCKTYTITVEGKTPATFSFGEYVVGLGTIENAELDALLNAMYAYGKTAEVLHEALVAGTEGLLPEA